MKKKVFAIALSAALALSMAPIAFASEDENVDLMPAAEQAVCAECGEPESHAGGCSLAGAAESALFETLMAASGTAELHALLTADPEGADALTADEIDDVFSLVEALDPEGADPATEQLTDLLVSLPNFVSNAEADGEEAAGFAGTDFQTAFNNASGGTDSKSMYGEYVLNGTAYIDKIIYVPAGQTLKITGSGTIKRTGHSKTAGLDMFQLNERSKLIIGEKNEASTAKDVIVLDGEDAVVHRPFILAYKGGDVELYHVTLMNNRNRGDVSGSFAGSAFGGGAIYIAPSYKTVEGTTVLDYAPSITLYSCSIKDCSSYNYGGGIYSQGCDITLTKSEILRCNAIGSVKAVTNGDTTTSVFVGGILQSDGSYHADRGAGGGINLLGIPAYSLKPTCTITDSVVSYNTAVGYGGGIEIRNSASVVMNSGSLNYNTSLNRGAGALHVTADASFTMNGGEMVGNTCYEVGGAIHTSYTCVLNLNDGLIEGNIAYGRGGGIHVDVGGDLVLNGTDVKNNHAYDHVELNGVQYKNIGVSNIVGGVYVDSLGIVQSDPIWWGNAQFRGEAGYGGGVLVDCGTCTMNSGEISGNTADVGGGGLCFVMLLISTDSRFGQTGVSGFEMNGGKITGNSSNGDGAGVYLMRNVLTVEDVATSTGLTYTVDSDGGITFYKDDAPMIMTKADGTELSPQDLKALFEAVPVVEINAGTIDLNVATGKGGGIYQEQGTKFIINGGSMTENEAVDGGGVYVAQGEAFINGGTMSKNIATGNGGALFVNGNATMTNGIMGGASTSDANVAKNGGAVYVTGGNMAIEHGKLDYNSAEKGGAVYMAGTASTSLLMESGTMSNNKATDDGGAIYATSGTLKIGLEACKAEDEAGLAACAHHTDKGDGRYHPQIQGNSAADSGGGIAIADEGVVHFYCGSATGNAALYKGVGKNVFMDGGEFHLYDAANIGVPRDPDLVIVGGKLYNECANKTFVHLWYYRTNADSVTAMQGLAEDDETMNLPDGEYFWPTYADENSVSFAGWTTKGLDSSEGNQYVRNKDQYEPSGDPYLIDAETAENATLSDGTAVKVVKLYALWVPESHGITYVDGVDFTVVSHTPASYAYNKAAATTYAIPTIDKTGYALVGWYMYQNEGQNANWGAGYEPVYKAGTADADKGYDTLDYEKLAYIPATSAGSLNLTVPELTFGSITLIADYEPLKLTVGKTVSGALEADQTFMFRIVGTDGQANEGVDMTVALTAADFEETADGYAASVDLIQLPAGDYVVTEREDWSWRYAMAPGSSSAAAAKLGNGNDKTDEVSFGNVVDSGLWLSGEAIARNVFALVLPAVGA